MQLEELEKKEQEKVAAEPKVKMEIFCNKLCRIGGVCVSNNKPYCADYDLD
jgi:CDGSH-type Zn-finger protein